MMLARLASIAGLALALGACSSGSGKDGTCKVNCSSAGPFAWKALPTAGAPSARAHHSAVWTGKEMLVWGGQIDAKATPSADGAAYDPATSSWRPLAKDGAPSARHSHSAVWTGTKMLVWGGYAVGGLASGGGIYDPASDKWTAMPTAGEPAGRTKQGALWSGSQLIVWGGLGGAGATPLNTGGRFDVASMSWKPISGGSGPTSRALHGAVWTGSEMLVWGGFDTFDWFADGKRYRPDNDSWPSALQMKDAPKNRDSATAVWTGAAMIIWGGWNGFVFRDDGALYDPASDSWTAMASGAPEARRDHASVWTGKELLVWGGCGRDSCNTVFDDGGRYSRETGWSKVAADPILKGRSDPTAVWTGSEVIVFGGTDADLNPVGSGARAGL